MSVLPSMKVTLRVDWWAISSVCGDGAGDTSRGAGWLGCEVVVLGVGACAAGVESGMRVMRWDSRFHVPRWRPVGAAVSSRNLPSLRSVSE